MEAWTPIIAMGTLAAVFIASIAIISNQIGARISDLKTDLTNAENRLTERFEKLDDKLYNMLNAISKLGERTAQAEKSIEYREHDEMKEALKVWQSQSKRQGET